MGNCIMNSQYCHLVHFLFAAIFHTNMVPRTELLGDSDRYVKAGSTVVLRYVVKGALEAPTFIMWYHGSNQLTSKSARHQMQIDKNPPEIETEASSMISTLIIEVAKKRDSGNYMCIPPNSPTVMVALNVINGESSTSALISSTATYKVYKNVLDIKIVAPLILACKI